MKLIRNIFGIPIAVIGVTAVVIALVILHGGDGAKEKVTAMIGGLRR